jgi:hypothetical protein
VVNKERDGGKPDIHRNTTSRGGARESRRRWGEEDRDGRGRRGGGANNKGEEERGRIREMRGEVPYLRYF